MSHSKSLPVSVGSFIQSYWPCITLWPISMLSRIFDSESAAVPAIQAGGRKPANMQAAAADLQAALGADHVADVVGVALAEVGEDALADGVELLAEGLDLLGGQV